MSERFQRRCMMDKTLFVQRWAESRRPSNYRLNPGELSIQPRATDDPSAATHVMPSDGTGRAFQQRLQTEKGRGASKQSLKLLKTRSHLPREEKSPSRTCALFERLRLSPFDASNSSATLLSSTTFYPVCIGPSHSSSRGLRMPRAPVLRT